MEEGKKGSERTSRRTANGGERSSRTDRWLNAGRFRIRKQVEEESRVKGKGGIEETSMESGVIDRKNRTERRENEF